MIKHQLVNFLNKKRSTLLGVGPMSNNCVDVTIELSNKYEIPIFLIASRRQIDSEEFSGGYVNNWTTTDFANYVYEKDKKGRVILARDHGGPWQNPREIENNLGLQKAMESAKSSFLEDIKSGFKVLHIDPSIDIHSSPSIDEILDRIFELYEYCWTEAEKLKKDIIFEIGTEEQSGSTNTQEELCYALSKIKIFCESNNLPEPTFVVVQSGTRVKETKNVGSFDSPLRVANEIPAEIQIPKMIQICKENNIFMKAHNTDYLSNNALSWHPKLGIHAANVAPEFGVTETQALLDILEENGLYKIAEELIKISYNSGKWKKWLIKDSKISDREKAIIAGHYVFSEKSFFEFKTKASKELSIKGVDLDGFLKAKIRKSIMRYLNNFRLIK